MLDLSHVWTSTGSSGAVGDPVYVRFGALEAVMQCQVSTIATTQSWSFRTAQESTGPWFTEASTAMSTAAASQTALRITGMPAGWAQPYLNTESTGTYQFRLTAMG